MREIRLEKTQAQRMVVSSEPGLCVSKETSLTIPALSIWHFAEEL